MTIVSFTAPTWCLHAGDGATQQTATQAGGLGTLDGLLKAASRLCAPTHGEAPHRHTLPSLDGRAWQRTTG